MVRLSFVSLIIVGVLKLVTTSDNLYDNDLYERVLNNVTCRRHLEEMQLFQFYDASGRIPQSITLGGQGSLGNYQQCLSIAQQLTNDTIWGKYCMVGVPLGQSLPPVLDPGPSQELIGKYFELINMSDNDTDAIQGALIFKRALRIMTGNGITRAMPNTAGGISTNVAVCIPRSCTTHQVFGQYTDMLNVTYNDLYCRLPDDKIFSTVDYVADVTILLLGTLTALSTSYDMYNTFVLEVDVLCVAYLTASTETSKMLTSFSVFTNTRRLFTLSNTPGSIDCLDGLRSLSILWVVIGHTFSNMLMGTTVNILTAYQWVFSSKSIWITSAVLSVDTFFMMSGLLVVYTTVKKMTPMSLVKNIHMFYLHRLLRMFPLLAAVVLFQASLFHHSADGPGWVALASSVTNCRKWWWSALLHVQNYVNATEICLAQSWYLSVDTQLHVISPLVLFWVLCGRRAAWLGLAGGLFTAIVGTTVYCYINNFPEVSLLGMGADISLISKYFKNYYINTLARSLPFFVGMLYGYLLHIWRENPKRISKWFVTAGWLGATTLGSGMIYCNDTVLKINHFWSNFLNSYMRGLWALAVGWVVFACAQGYGGPVNWFLSLKMWKFVARISYALYLIHYPIQAMIRGQNEMPFMFSVKNLVFVFYTDIAISLMSATALCVLVDAPFSTIQKSLSRGTTTYPVAPPPSNGLSSSTEVLVSDDQIR